MKKFEKLLTMWGEGYSLVQGFFILLYVIMIVSPVAIPWSMIFAISITNLFYFVFAKDYATINAFMLYRISLVLLVFAILHNIFVGLKTITGIGVMLPVQFMLYFTAIILLFFGLFFENEKKQQIIDNISVKDAIRNKVLEEDGLVIDEENDSCDVIICNKPDSKTPVILQGEDRYVHSLIIGATGSGKTSQALLPVIDQDIKYGRGVIVLEPKGDLAEKAYALGQYYHRENNFFFDPLATDCPYYNVFDGEETEVIETVVTTFLSMEAGGGQSPYWGNMTDNLLRKAIMVIKRIEKAYMDFDTGISSRPATLITLSDLIHNTDNRGRDMVNELTSLPTIDDSIQKQNIDTKDWFLNEYFANNSKAYQDTSNIRSDIAKLCQNKYLRKVLNPPDGKSQLNFDKILEEGQCISMTISQGALGNLGTVLGYFLILNFERAVFRRPGTEWTRKPCFFYVDEFQIFSNKEFSALLEQGRSYRVGCTLATQSRERVKMGKGVDGQAFLSSVDTNTRNKILLPGLSSEDAAFFEKEFGTELVTKLRTSESHGKVDLVSAFSSSPRMGTESVSKEEVEVAQHSSTSIRYKDFSYLTYQIIKNKTLQRASDGQAAFLERKVSKKVDKIVENYHKVQTRKRQEEDRRILEAERALYTEYQKRKSRTKNVNKSTTINSLTNQSNTVAIEGHPVNVKPPESQSRGLFGTNSTTSLSEEPLKMTYVDDGDNEM